MMGLVRTVILLAVGLLVAVVVNLHGLLGWLKVPERLSWQALRGSPKRLTELFVRALQRL